MRAQANRDAWLYCFHSQENGAVTPIFPGERMLGARIPGSQPVDIADSRRGRLLLVGPPAGREVIACFATSRDVTGRLPADWLNDRLAPLPGLQLGEVQRAFAEMTDVETAAGQVAIQVVDR